jgi:hypothetical protein
MDRDGWLNQISHTLDIYEYFQKDKAFNQRCSEGLINNESMENTYNTRRNIYTNTYEWPDKISEVLTDYMFMDVMTSWKLSYIRKTINNEHNIQIQVR